MKLLPAFCGAPAVDAVYQCKAEHLLAAIPDNHIDLIVTSPPYDNLRQYSGNWSFDFEGISRESYRVLKSGGVLVWVVDDAMKDGSKTLTSFEQALYFKNKAGFNFHQTIVWEQKSVPQKRQQAYYDDFEFMFILSKGQPKTFNPVMRKNWNAGEINRKGHSGKNGYDYANGKRVVKDVSMLTNVWPITVGFNHSTTDDIAHLHPAIFPEVLAERHILTWSNPGDLVLDYFGGSGTTAKMARANGRRYITGDISFEYVELMRRRLALPYTLPMFETVASESA